MMRPRLRIPLRPRLVPVPAPARPAFAPRSMHSIVQLDYNIKKEATANGLSKFLSPTAFNIAWTQYQTHLLERLNGMVAGTDWESLHVKDIMLATAREPSLATIFNHASMIHNNHFFFKNLSPKPVAMPDGLRTHLENSFGSIETLRQEMVHTAASMFGPGFVWLVKTSQTGLPVSFKVLATYAAGSPYPAAHWRRQDADLNTAAGPNSKEGIAAGRAYFDNSAFGAGRHNNSAAAQRNRFAPGGTDLLPVLCLNTWEHVWLWDYGFGVGGTRGKMEYAENWWNQIDWERVHKEANVQRLEMSSNPTGASAPAAA